MNQIKTNSTISDSIKNKRLSVQISLTGQSFLISCNNTNKVEWKASESWPYAPTGPSELLDRTILGLEKLENLLPQITEVKLYYHTSLYTLVPTKIWSDKDPSQYLKYNLQTFPHDFIAHEPVLNGDAQLVYIPFVNLNNYFFEKFGSFHYYHALGPWIDYATKVIGEQTGVFVNLNAKQLDVLVFKSGKLHLVNSFEYHVPEDVAYYTLFIYEQLDIDVEATPIYLSGDIQKQSPLFSVLYTYIRHVEFIPTHLLTISQIEQEEPHMDLLLKLEL